MGEMITIAILSGLLAAAVIAWVWSGIRQAGKDVDRIVHLSGQPEPCCAGNGQSMGQWVYCDREVGHDGPHEGWMSTLAKTEPGVKYWAQVALGARTKWTDFEPMPERAELDAEEEPA